VLLSAGLLLTLWSASGAIMVLIKAVNRAYDMPETRSWWKRRLMASGLAVAGAVLLPSGVLLVVLGARVGDWLGRELGPDSGLRLLWLGLRWPVVFVLLVLIVGAFYYLAPCTRQRWYTVLPGSLFAVGAIVLSSLGLSWFLSQNLFAVRWLTYGVIGTAIVLLFWAFLIGLMILFGGEINAAVLRASMRKREVGLVESTDNEQLGVQQP
ncbi:MAG: YihY/virulence factor BrkB family protein, partial [Thermoleophilia bacterium]|nr:YihY/virulence factor BrkB family protein [Thermoleophilia bacterium]